MILEELCWSRRLLKLLISILYKEKYIQKGTRWRNTKHRENTEKSVLEEICVGQKTRRIGRR